MECATWGSAPRGSKSFFLIMKKIAVSLLLAFVSLYGAVMGQSLEEQFAADPGKSGGVYYAYPAPASLQLTAPPKGYKSFYISHYGRHGSRYMLADNDYTKLIVMLEKADSAQVLTPTGKDLLQRARKAWEEAQGHTDELAPLGKRQHRDIAERMFKAYPEVFKQKGVVTARSTTSLRCALSMVAFCERLKELDPKMNIDWETSKKNMVYMNWHNEEYNALKRSPNGWMKDFMKFCARPSQFPSRFVNQIVADTSFFRKNHLSAQLLMTATYDVASDLQDMETDVTMYDLFTPAELVECWRNGNAWFYFCDGNAAATKGTALSSCKHLLANIVEQADKAVAGEGDVATLRFGHDGNIIPLAACLHLKDCDAYLEDAMQIEHQWHNFYVSPMAANIQLVFFRKKGSDDVLVKVLLNEHETSINGLESDLYPFYHWSDVRQMIVSE